MYVIIDDIRELGCDIIARNGHAGIKILTALNGNFDVLCIDNDLSDASEMDGIDVIKYAAKHNLLPSQVEIVSSNPVGVTNIGNVLKDNGFHPDPSNRVFKRKE